MRDLERVADAGYAASERPLVVLGGDDAVRLVAGYLRETGVSADRIYLNTGAIEGFERAMGPRGASGQVVILEFDDVEGFTRYAGHPPIPGHRPGGLPTRERLTALKEGGRDTAIRNAAPAPRALQQARKQAAQSKPERSARDEGAGEQPGPSDLPPRRAGTTDESSRPQNDNGAVDQGGKGWTTDTRPGAVGPLRTAKPEHEIPGTPVDQVSVKFDEMIGWERPNSMLVFRQARASEPPAALRHACIAEPLQDPAYRETLVREPRKLQDASAYLPGLYGTVWKTAFGNHTVGLGRVGVLRDGGKPDSAVSLQVYWDHGPTFAGSARPDINVWAAVDAYAGDAGVLLRVYPGADAWPVRCIDVVFARDNPRNILWGRLYHDNGSVRATRFAPEYKPYDLSSERG